jgi:hypothetical protein
MRTVARSNVFLVGVAVAAAALLAVAVVLAMRPTPQLDPGTPEGAVQGYFQALLDNDAELAGSYLAGDLADRCESDLKRRSEDGVGVVIVDVTSRGAHVRVDVEITETYGSDPFGGSSYSFDETLVLEKHGDRWLIAEPPWPIYYCPEAQP